MEINIESIDKAFEELISRRGIHSELGITSDQVRQYRKRMNNKSEYPVKLETKIALLQKSGWRQGQQKFSEVDLVAVVRLALKKSEAAKKLGAEYIVEEFLKKK